MERNFSWDSLGKADYSQAGAIVASLPAPLRMQLSGPGREVLCRIIYLLWYSAQKSGRQKASCVPSEAYLAKAASRSVRTVRRLLGCLEEIGLVIWRQRKGAWNDWQTNRYQPGKALLALLVARFKGKVQQIHRGTKMADYDLKREYKSGKSDEARTLTEILQDRIRQRPPALADGQPEELAYATDEWKSVVDRRKAVLRAQAEYLKARGL